MHSFVSKLLQGPYCTRDSSFFLNALIFFYPQGNIYFFDPSPSLYCRSQHHQHHQTYTSLHSSQCFTQAHTRAHTHNTHTPTHTLVICSFTTPSASSPYLPASFRFFHLLNLSPGAPGIAWEISGSQCPHSGWAFFACISHWFCHQTIECGHVLFCDFIWQVMRSVIIGHLNARGRCGTFATIPICFWCDFSLFQCFDGSGVNVHAPRFFWPAPVNFLELNVLAWSVA